MFGSHLRPLLRDGLADETIILNIMSMFAQILFFNFSRIAVTRLTGKTYDHTFTTTLIEHITDFVVRGFRAIDKKEASCCAAPPS
jgi:hypothetical protein